MYLLLTLTYLSAELQIPSHIPSSGISGMSIPVNNSNLVFVTFNSAIHINAGIEQK